MIRAAERNDLGKLESALTDLKKAEVLFSDREMKNMSSDEVAQVSVKAEARMSELIFDALIRAGQHGHLLIVQWLLNMNPKNVLKKDTHGMTVLSWAICMGYLYLVKWLVVSAGADVTEVDAYGQTALMLAVRRSGNNIDIVRWLVEDGRSNIAAALLYAASRHHYSTIHYMLTNAGQSVSDELWLKLQPLSANFIYEVAGVRCPKPSSLLMTMLLSHHPVPEVEIGGRSSNRNRRFFVRTQAHATRLLSLLPTWLAEKYVELEITLGRLPKAIVTILSAYAYPSPDEIWSLLSVLPLRRNPDRVARKRRR